MYKKPLKIFQNQSNKKNLISSAIGNMLEFYSFTLFALFLPIISPLFFPSSNSFATMLCGYIVFAVGFLAYPLGAILFGYIGDRSGRKTALIISIVAIAVPTVIIGLLPTYSVIGVLAPLALFACRIVQGICAGGEYIGAGILTIENAPKHQTGFHGSITAAFGTGGALLAGLITYVFTLPTMPEWAWRIPFLLAAPLSLGGLYLRYAMKESKEFKTYFISSVKRRNPLVEVITDKSPAFLCIIGIGALGTVPFYFIIGFLNNHLESLKYLSSEQRIILNTSLLFFSALTLPIAGYISDKIGHYRIMFTAAIGTILFSYPFLCMTYNKSLFLIILPQIIFLSLSQGYVAPLNAFASRLLPIHIRYTGVALGYCIGMGLFGGLSPYISAKLIELSNDNIAPAYYLIFIGFLGLMSIIIGRRIQTLK